MIEWMKFIAALLAVGTCGRIMAADAPATRPAAAEQTRDNAPSVTWENDPAHRNALLWHAEFERVGSLAVSQDKVLVGGSRTGPKGNTQGCMFFLSAQTGKIPWTVAHDKLPERIHDMAGNISSTPRIDGDRIYYVSN